MQVYRIIGRNAPEPWIELKRFDSRPGDGMIDYWIDRLGQRYKQVFYQENWENKIKFPPLARPTNNGAQGNG